MKSCTKCEVPKSLEMFSKNKNTKDGHHAWCKACLKISKAVAYLKNKDHYNAKARTGYLANREKYNALGKQWRAANPELMRGYIEKYRTSAKGRETRNADNRKRYASGYRKAWNGARHALLKSATPPWVDRKAIAAFYRDCPDGFHVDHIMPLKGRNFSGLHVLWNLQYLPASENLRKSNKLVLG